MLWNWFAIHFVSVIPFLVCIINVDANPTAWLVDTRKFSPSRRMPKSRQRPRNPKAMTKRQRRKQRWCSHVASAGSVAIIAVYFYFNTSSLGVTTICQHIVPFELNVRFKLGQTWQTNPLFLMCIEILLCQY